MRKNSSLNKEDKRIVNSIFWRSFFSFAGRAGGQIRQQSPGFIWTLNSALEEYYEDDEKGYAEALTRHTTFYNITPHVGTFVMALVASMEKKYSESKDFDPNAIVAIKTSLMGPLSGIGDSIFWGVIRIIAAGVGISMAANGSILGPIAFLLIFNIPAILTRYYTTVMGYTVGSDFIERVHSTGLMDIVTKAANTLGLIMVGGMTASIIKFNAILELGVGEDGPVILQTYLDDIFKGLVPLTVTLLCFYALKKKVNVNVIMFGVMLFAIFLALFGVV